MDINDDDHQDLETLETLSLTDFPLTVDHNSCGQTQDHDNIIRTPPSPSTQDLFEFCSGSSSGLPEQHIMNNMSHAEDIISGGKLIPINNQNRNEKHIIHHGRCESMRELKTTGAASQLFRNSCSFDHKKLNRNSLSNKSSSVRWTDIVFAPMKVPPEMDLRDIRNRVQNTSKSLLFHAVETGGDRFAVNRVGDHNRKTSWRVLLGFLSCRRSGSVAVAMPLS